MVFTMRGTEVSPMRSVSPAGTYSKVGKLTSEYAQWRDRYFPGAGLGFLAGAGGRRTARSLPPLPYVRAAVRVTRRGRRAAGGGRGRFRHFG